MTTAGFAPLAHAAPASDGEMVQALRAGSEDAFTLLLHRYQAQMLRLASMYVTNRAVAEEVVQEAWLGVLTGIARFEERCSLKTWIFRILVNRAKTRAQREGRSVPFSAIWSSEEEPAEPSVEPDRFLASNHPTAPHHWTHAPRDWNDLPEEHLLTGESRARINAAIDTLPPVQRQVIALRDIEGWTSNEICEALGISEANQRVLLHRARSRVRRAIEEYLRPVS